MTKNDNRNSIFMTGFLAERDTKLVIKYLPSISIDNRWKGDNKYKAFSAENLKETENTIIFYVRNIWRKTLPKYCPSFADNDERLLVCIVWVNVTDGSAGELEWKLTIPPRQIIACNYERHHRLGCGESIGSQ